MCEAEKISINGNKGWRACGFSHPHVDGSRTFHALIFLCLFCIEQQSILYHSEIIQILLILI